MKAPAKFAACLASIDDRKHYFLPVEATISGTWRTFCGLPVGSTNIKGWTKTCRVCAGRSASVVKGQKQAATSHEVQSLDAMLRTTLANTMKRASQKRWEYDLTWEWLQMLAAAQDGRCGMTGVPFRRIEGERRQPWTPSVDRISNARGYTKDNCRLVCSALNIALGEWGERVFSEIAEKYIEFRYW